MADQTPALQAAMLLPPRVTATHVYFLGEASGHELDCLSQWYRCSFVDKKSSFVPGARSRDTNIFRTTEQYMVLGKAVLMDDLSTAAKILKAETPHETRTLGGQVSPFDGEKWRSHRDRIVERANWLKFAQNDELKTRLLNTGDRILVEGNPEDRIWGVGWNNDEAEGKEDEWGENRLGKALMKARDRLKNGDTWEKELNEEEAKQQPPVPQPRVAPLIGSSPVYDSGADPSRSAFAHLIKVIVDEARHCNDRQICGSRSTAQSASWWKMEQSPSMTHEDEAHEILSSVQRDEKTYRLLYISCPPTYPFRSHWSLFLPALSQPLGSSDVGKNMIYCGRRVHATGDVKNGFETRFVRNADLEHGPLSVGKARIVPVAWIAREHCRPRGIGDDGDDGYDAMGEEHEDTDPRDHLEEMCLRVPAPGPSLRTAGQTDVNKENAEKTETRKRVELKDCQWWLRQVLEFLQDQAVVLPLEGDEDIKFRLDQVPQH